MTNLIFVLKESGKYLSFSKMNSEEEEKKNHIFLWAPLLYSISSIWYIPKNKNIIQIVNECFMSECLLWYKQRDILSGSTYKIFIKHRSSVFSSKKKIHL